MEVKVILPSKEKYIISGSCEFDVCTFPSANITQFQNDYIEVATSYYQENRDIRPQRKTHINYDGQIILEQNPPGYNNGYCPILSKVELKEWDNDKNLIAKSLTNCTDDTDYLTQHQYYNDFGEIVRSYEVFYNDKIKYLPIKFRTYVIREKILTIEQFAKHDDLENFQDMGGNPIEPAKFKYLKYTNINDFPELNDIIVDYFMYVKWNDWVLTFISNKVYILSNTNGTILKSICSKSNDLQEGDCRTSFYLLNNKHFIVNNDGDVYSVILFTNKQQIDETANIFYLSKRNRLLKLEIITKNYLLDLLKDHDSFNTKMLVFKAAGRFNITLQLLKDGKIPEYDFYWHYRVIKNLIERFNNGDVSSDKALNKKYFDILKTEILGLLPQ